MKLRWQRQVAWLTLCAVFLAAVAPAVTHAISRVSTLAYAELCSTATPRRIAPDERSTPAPADERPGSAHCPFCRLHSYAPALPAPGVALAIPIAFDIRPPLAEARLELPTGLLWSSARSRAPPAFS